MAILSKPITKVDKDVLDNFIEFVNADIQPMDKADFVRILIKYTEFLGQYDANYPYLSLRSKYRQYTDGIMEDEFDEHKTHLKLGQGYYRKS